MPVRILGLLAANALRRCTLQTCLWVMAITVMSSGAYASGLTLEAGLNSQVFDKPADQVRDGVSPVVLASVRSPRSPSGRFSAEWITGAIGGPQATEFTSASLGLHGSGLSLQAGPALLSRTTEHLSTHWQFAIGVRADYGRLTIRFLHLSNGQKRLGHRYGPNIGEDMLMLGWRF